MTTTPATEEPSRATPLGYDEAYAFTIVTHQADLLTVDYLDDEGKAFLREDIDPRIGKVFIQQEVNRATGKLEGRYKEYHRNGTLCKDCMINAAGRFEGAYEQYDEHGVLIVKGNSNAKGVLEGMMWRRDAQGDVCSYFADGTGKEVPFALPPGITVPPRNYAELLASFHANHTTPLQEQKTSARPQP